MGLPSGTLWLDRLVGAPAPNADGLFYQWGDIIGHSLAEGYNFSNGTYASKGLNLITSDLDEAHDAARAYYGPKAKMPSNTHFNELINNCVLTRQGGLIVFTSRINGASIKIPPHGFISNTEVLSINEIRAWATNIRTGDYATSLHVDTAENGFVGQSNRSSGCFVMAIHS